ncbi:MAG: hypothetical protein PVH89_04635 [Gammaproteobacteria bacterium]
MISSLRFTALLSALLSLLPAAAHSQGEAVEFEGIRVFEPYYYVEFDPQSALQMVWRTPGFNPQESDGGRGLSGVRSNVLINGERPPPKGQSVRAQLGEMPVAAVVRIELIDAGARQDVDMQGYPQVVNVVTVEDRPAYYEINTQLQRTGTGRIRQQNTRQTQVEATGSFTWKAHEIRMSADVRDRTNRPPARPDDIDPANPEQRFRSPNRFEQNNEGIELGAIFDLPGDSSLNFTSQFSTGESESIPVVNEGDAGDLGDLSQTFRSSDNTDDDQEISAEYRRPIASRGEMMVAIVDAERTGRNASSFTTDALIRNSISDSESGETATRLLFTTFPTEKLTVRTTLNNAYNYSEGQFQYFENGVNVPIPGSDSRVEEDRRSLDAAVDWNLSDRWTLSGDIGLESYQIDSRDVSSGEQTDPKGSIKASFRPQPRTTLSFETDRSIGQLSFGQFLASTNLSSEINTAGAAELEPVRSWNHSVVYDRRFGDVGVMRFELSREERDNPIRTVALSDSLFVSQNTSSQTIDSIRASVEVPFTRFNREDLILGIEGGGSTSDTIDPVTGEQREVSGNPWRFWNVQFRRDPRAGDLAWNVYAGRQTQGDNYSVRSINESTRSHEWGGSIEWEVIDGLKIRTELNGPSSESWTQTFFGAVRTLGLDPSFLASTVVRRDRQASVSVEWRGWNHIEIRASLSTQPKVRTVESLTAFGEMLGTMLVNEIESSPRAWLRFRVYR